MNYRHLWLENGASTLSMAIKVTCLRFTCRLLPTLVSTPTYTNFHVNTFTPTLVEKCCNQIITNYIIMIYK